jgi:Protein of unknown function (DUF3379)
VICEDARLLIGATPADIPRELAVHLEACEQCGALRREMRSFEADLRRALLEPPDMSRFLTRRRRPPAWRGWALAASVLLVSCAALAAWLLVPSQTLAHQVVAHVEGEPQSWLATQHVSAAGIQQVLRKSGVQLELTSEQVVYAQSCWFRGHYVPHLVLQTARGPATVILLRHEPVTRREAFKEAGMQGIIVPAQPGSIALLTRGRGADLEALAGEMQRDTHWMPESQ